MKKFAKVILIIGLLAICAWISLNYLIWFLPSQPGTRDIALADLDGDGDLDAFLANGRNEGAEPNTVLLNDGKGNFQNSEQKLGSFESIVVILEDFDRDGDMDALVSNISWGCISGIAAMDNLNTADRSISRTLMDITLVSGDLKPQI